MAITTTYTPKDGITQRTYYGFIVNLEAGFEVTGLKIQMDVRDKNGNTVATYVVGNGIDILTSLSFKFNPGILEIKEGVYQYDILIPYPNREVSWISGNWTIKDSVTRKI